MKFRHAIVAGTFDHLHAGHRKLLLTAIHQADRISCGLTHQSLTRKKPLSSLIQSPHQRRQELASLLASKSRHWTIFPLKHPIEPAASSLEFDAIVASQETAPAVSRINQLRKKKHLQPLRPIIINLLPSSDKNRLSSTRIRQGKINRQGLAYQQIFPQNNSLILPSLQRHHFRRPFDTLLVGSQNCLHLAGLQAKKLLIKNPPFLTIAVGDIATMSLLQQHLPLNLAIVDLKTKRRPLFNNIAKLGLSSTVQHFALNPPGQITPQLVASLNRTLNLLLNHPACQTILVNGEEDLAVLPAILLSPLNTVIFYGQPNKGLVYIRVTEASKQKALTLLQKFR
jgi:cytidyltransferase-like protein